MKTVSDMMTLEVKSCAPGDTLSAAARIMWERDCGVVPVVDQDGRLAGLITDRDICMAAYLRGQRLEECLVGDVMSRPAVTCRPDETIERAEASMREHQIRRLPIVDESGRLCGILSMNDLVLATPAEGQRRGEIRPETVVSTLAGISRHRHPQPTAH
jgi:CBS domain-containing protein